MSLEGKMEALSAKEVSLKERTNMFRKRLDAEDGLESFGSASCVAVQVARDQIEKLNGSVTVVVGVLNRKTHVCANSKGKAYVYVY